MRISSLLLFIFSVKQRKLKRYFKERLYRMRYWRISEAHTWMNGERKLPLSLNSKFWLHLQNAYLPIYQWWWCGEEELRDKTKEGRFGGGQMRSGKTWESCCCCCGENWLFLSCRWKMATAFAMSCWRWTKERFRNWNTLTHTYNRGRDD